MACSYCADGADHEAVDHRDPARATAVAERYESEGDTRASLWREVARRVPKRRTTPTKLTVELIAAWLKSPIELDFVLRAGHKPVVVECDGHEFHQKTKAQVAKDRARDRYFVERGYIVIRYTGSEIRRNARLCAEQAIAIAMGELVR